MKKRDNAPEYLVQIKGYWTGSYDFKKSKNRLKKEKGGGEIVCSQTGNVLYKKEPN